MTLRDYAACVERALERYLSSARTSIDGGTPDVLLTAMRYSVMAGGKRLRPSMLLATVDMLGGEREPAMAAACAIEMIHTYSLIHDDLPGMDDDVLRRGKPTNHVVFGVGQAILAGDALLNAAYEFMLENAIGHPEALLMHMRAIEEIARVAGARGMVGGQSADLSSEGEGVWDEGTLEFIHLHKTAGLFIGAMRAGGWLAGAGEDELEALTGFARAFGLMFQAVDDVLDVEGERSVLGKGVGKDAAGGKLTAVSLLGLDGARARVRALHGEAVEALAPFGARAGFFRKLADDMLDRKA